MLESAGAARCLVLTDRESGLRAFLVLDDLTLGPGAGGVRTFRYASSQDALADAAKLARAMTLKCSLAGLDAGGAKAVVIDHAGLDRHRAFSVLGERVEELGGLFQTAGDLGTTAADLKVMATRTRYVNTEEGDLSGAVALGLLGCMRSCAQVAGRGVGIAGLRVAVQGCGAIGGAVARALAREGAQLVLSDVERSRAEALATELGATVCPPEDILLAEVDVLCPCAVGGVLTAEIADQLRAWAVCGAANNVLAGPIAGQVLRRRGVLFVPDIIASAGAVVEGIGQSVMKLPERKPLILRLGGVAREVLEEARATGRSEVEVAEARAWRRIQQARC